MSGRATYALRRARRLIGKRVQYALMRNITSRGANEKRLISEGPRVLANSIPKAGTNLLSRLMRMMPNTVDRWTYHIDETLSGIERQLRAVRHGQVVTSHFPWSADIASIVGELDFRVLLIVRDPRDIAISNVNYVTRMDFSHPLHPALAALPDDNARLLAMIEPPLEIMAGLPEVWKNEGLATFLPWLEEPNCLIVRFEDLVGEKGGGSDARQIETKREIAGHIGASLDESQLKLMAQNLFGSGSRTFHKGQIGNWRTEFSPEATAAFKRQSSEALMKFGYESDLDW